MKAMNEKCAVHKMKPRLTSNFHSARQFHTAHLPAARSAIVAAFFIFCFGDDRWHYDFISSGVDGDKSEIGGTDVTALLGAVVFHPDLHAHLHRSAVDAIDRRAQDYEISDPNGHKKVHVINGSRHHIRAGMAVGG